MPLPRYFSIPSLVLGAVLLSAPARNWRPNSRSRTQCPSAVSHSPGFTEGSEPTTVTSSRCPLALTLRTAKPFSSLKKVTRSISPERLSGGLEEAACNRVEHDSRKGAWQFTGLPFQPGHLDLSQVVPPSQAAPRVDGSHLHPSRPQCSSRRRKYSGSWKDYFQQNRWPRRNKYKSGDSFLLYQSDAGSLHSETFAARPIWEKGIGFSPHTNLKGIEGVRKSKAGNPRSEYKRFGSSQPLPGPVPSLQLSDHEHRFG